VSVICETNERGRWAGLVVALMTEPDVKAAARRVGVSYTTARRWLRRPAFAAMLREARLAVLAGVTARLQQLATEAVRALEQNLSCGAPGVEVRTATAILERATASAELTDVLAGMGELRRKLEELQAREANRATA
jgi:hypothetical protein